MARAQVEEEAKSLAETQFRNVPVEVKVDGDSFTSLYEEDGESYDAVTYCNFAGKAFLGSGEDKVVLDIRHTSSSTSQDPTNIITSTVFYYKDAFVKDARDLYSKILEEGS